MVHSIGTIPVRDAMQTTLITVSPTKKIDLVAKLFDKEDINAAPVVDGLGKCVGVITSHDLVQYESIRIEVEQSSKHGLAFDFGYYDDGSAIGLVGRPFDEVAYHMSTKIETIGTNEPLSRGGRLMCQKHIHHLKALDDGDRPIGILSSLDIIGQALGEPVSRAGCANRALQEND